MSRNRNRRRSGSGGRPQGAPRSDRVAELEAELERERQREQSEWDARFDAELEGAQPTKAIQFKGRTYRLPATADDWDLETAEAYERNNLTIAIAGILGREQWEQIKRAGAKVKDLKALADEIGRAYGFESMGESGASSD